MSMEKTAKVTQCIRSNADVQKYEVIWGYFSVVMTEHDVIWFRVLFIDLNLMIWMKKDS